MGNLAFPQLSSGAYVQYPLRRQRLIQSVLNSFADGTMLASSQNANQRWMWDLIYNDLTATDQAALQTFFAQCRGPLLPFIFIDPTSNMLSSSANLLASVWQADPELTVTPGAADPNGGTSAFTLVNSSQVSRQITQQVLAPANFQYCLSVFAYASSAAELTLSLSATSSQNNTFALGESWLRFVNSGQLTDAQTGLNVAISIPAGQTVTVFGPQLEPQLAPSRYRATEAAGGVYPNAHFLTGALTFTSDAPGLFSTSISIESS
jgi:hypothetical protein